MHPPAGLAARLTWVPSQRPSEICPGSTNISFPLWDGPQGEAKTKAPWTPPPTAPSTHKLIEEMAWPVESQRTLLLFLVQDSFDMHTHGDTQGQGTVWIPVLEEPLNLIWAMRR